jgi:nucleoside-diphosphate-sugar epimerase
MRVFVAGGSGVIGVRLVPLLVAAGHEVTAMTRTTAKVDAIQALGAEAVCCDVFDRDALVAALATVAPDAVIHQLTDLPDDPADLARRREANATIREVGTANLIAAAQACGCHRLLVQSIAWLTDGRRPPSVEHLERRTRAADGVVLRYGQWYGTGTYHPDAPPPPPRIGVDAAAQATLAALALDPGTYEVTDDGTTLVADA